MVLNIRLISSLYYIFRVGNKITSVSTVCGGWGVRPGTFGILVLGLVGVPSTLVFVIKLTILMALGVSIFGALALLTGFLGALIYLRVFTVFWSRGHSGCSRSYSEVGVGQRTSYFSSAKLSLVLFIILCR